MTPLWPPITGTLIEEDLERSPRTSATKVEARTTSKVVTPKSLRNTLCECQFNNELLVVPLGVEHVVLLEYFSNDGDR